MKEGPSERTYRSRFQTTFRCCVLGNVVVSGEGKGPEVGLDQVTSRKRTERELPFLVSKRVRSQNAPYNNQHSESWVAVDRTNASHIVGVDKFFFDPAFYLFHIGAKVTFDGGKT